VRIGIFGGTFDPPHVGHLIVAQDALRTLALDRVIFVPAALPPHKQNQAITPAALRLRMLSAAIDGDARFSVDEIELERSGPSYTVDTLRAFRRRHPAADLFLLIGADQFSELATWREPEEIARLAHLAVMTRGGEGGGAGAALTVPVTRIDLSATGIRRRVAAGASIRYLVPEAVETLIRAHALYTPEPETAGVGPTNARTVEPQGGYEGG
jgi:nicotinate-nucleotide adenylyltransferase